MQTVTTTSSDGPTDHGALAGAMVDSAMVDSAMVDSAPAGAMVEGALVVGVLGRGIVNPAEPVLRADDLGLARGDGCFETARVITDADGQSRVDNLDAHLHRLARSTAILDIAVDLNACRNLILEVCAAWTEPGQAAVKLMVSRGVEGNGRPTVLATVRPASSDSLRQRTDGIRAVTLARGTASDAYADAPWLLGGVKSLSYALNMAAQREAVRLGAHDAIWVSTDGLVLEAPTSAVVWSLGGKLVTTPDGATGILASTTVAALFEGAATDGVLGTTGFLAVAELDSVDGLWLVSSIRGMAQVLSIDGRPLPRDPAFTDRLNTYAGF